MSTKGLVQRLSDGEDVIIAEGYLFEFERRGYLKAGSFVPEVVLDFPHKVKELHDEFVHAGSDVVQAFTYYGHREKMRLIGKEHLLERLNVDALKIAREVADETGTLMAGNICNTTVYQTDKPETKELAEAIFKNPFPKIINKHLAALYLVRRHRRVHCGHCCNCESPIMFTNCPRIMCMHLASPCTICDNSQIREGIEWAVQGGADLIIGETFVEYAEAELALDCVKKYGQGLPSVINLAPCVTNTTCDGIPLDVACKKLEDRGAEVVGLNCSRGPITIIPIMKKIRQMCKGPIAAIPVPYRTTPEYPVMQSLVDQDTNLMAFPENLPAWQCSRYQIREFAKECKEIGVQVVGLCCGNASHYMREIAEVYGRKPPASKYSTDMSLHFIFGNKSHFSTYHTDGHKAMFQSKTTI